MARLLAMILAGGYGESLGQLHHPFMVAIGPRDDVFVSDVINGRVSVFTAQGKPVSPIGSYGIERGQTYRPKGIACDGAGRRCAASFTARERSTMLR